MTRPLERWKILTVHQKNTRIKFVIFLIVGFSFLVSQMGVGESINFIGVLFAMFAVWYTIVKMWEKVKLWCKR